MLIDPCVVLLKDASTILCNALISWMGLYVFLIVILRTSFTFVQ